MSKQTKTVDQETDAEQDLDLDIDDANDYGFIIGPDGELKHMFLPDGFVLDPPATVRKILKVFGIKDVNEAYVTDDTIH